jgi:hypothetical protein
MAPYLKLVLAQTPSLLSTSSQPTAQALLERLEAKNKPTLEAIATKLEEAEKTEGETEISDALREKANYLTKIGDKVCIIILLSDARGMKLTQYITYFHVFCLGCRCGSSEACIDEDTRPWCKNRPDPYSCASRAFF